MTGRRSELMGLRLRQRKLAGIAVAASAVLAAWHAAPAWAGWRLQGATAASIAYNQGATFDPARPAFFFDGVSSITNSGLYRTTPSLVQTAANPAVLPATPEGYNHAGDLSFDAVGRRLLLALECYYPGAGGNTCGVGAIGVADPQTLRFLYYVDLDRTQIQKAMWVEISPDGRWIWTSSGTHLLVYRAAEVNRTIAERQRAGAVGGLMGTDLGPVLPSSEVTGAAFYEDALTRSPRLLLSLNRGTYSELISYPVGAAGDGTPRLLANAPTSELTVVKSSLDSEPEGLAVTGAGLSSNPLGGVLDWQMLPVITPTTVFTRILSFLPSPAPPRDGATTSARQRMRPALVRGLRVTVVCNSWCTSTATVTIDGRLARGLGLLSPSARLRPYTVGTGRSTLGHGRRVLSIRFTPRSRDAVMRVRSARLSLLVSSVDAYSRLKETYRLSVTVSR
jgi:hypothetical protein